MWIRNWRWDAAWILSGIPLGIVLTVLTGYVPTSLVVLWIILAVQTGHTLAPMALAWSHRGFREHMILRQEKYIWLPLAILVISTLIGFEFGGQIHFDPQSFAIANGPQSWADLKNPFIALVTIYALWNGWHFGRQAFGVMSVYRRKRDAVGSRNSDGGTRDRSAAAVPLSGTNVLPPKQTERLLRGLPGGAQKLDGGLPKGQAASRSIDLWYCCAVVWAAMLMPFVPQLAHVLHDLIGLPAHPHPFLERTRTAYLAAALVLPAAMLAREWFTTRSTPRAIFIATDGAALALVFHVGLWGFAVIALNHWLVAIGLASHMHNKRRPWSFALMVCAIGFVLFTVLFFNLPSVWAHGFTTAALSFTATAVAFRLGLGFVHFMYDRGLYQRGSPIWVNQEVARDRPRYSSPAILSL